MEICSPLMLRTWMIPFNWYSCFVSSSSPLFSPGKNLFVHLIGCLFPGKRRFHYEGSLARRKERAR